MAVLSVEFLEGSGGGLVIRLRDPEATQQIGRHLQTADRLAAISRLTGGVAHEVKNPLNAILMHVELAKMKLNHGDYDPAANHIISNGPSNAVIAGTTYTLPHSPGSPILQTPPPSANLPNLLTALSTAPTLANNAILTPGGPAATISSTTLSLPSQALPTLVKQAGDYGDDAPAQG